jgi:hypothetical protein
MRTLKLKSKKKKKREKKEERSSASLCMPLGAAPVSGPALLSAWLLDVRLLVIDHHGLTSSYVVARFAL